MAELDYITVEGFKSIKSIEELKPGPMTVLIGPNGSGKSNFLGVFSFLNAIRDGRLQEYVKTCGRRRQGPALRITSHKAVAYLHLVRRGQKPI